VGEHTTEARGVGGSIPPQPIFHNLYKTQFIKTNMPKEVRKSSDNSLGIVSVVMGILSIVLTLSILVGSFAGILLGVIGIFFALAQRKRNKNSWSKAGLWLSIIGIILAIVFIVLFISAIAEIAQQLQNSGALDTAALAAG
jgi:uncharacterized membrane protein HdeD (DUF308 family)